jgi:hypothetical protein
MTNFERCQMTTPFDALNTIWYRLAVEIFRLSVTVHKFATFSVWLEISIGI